ncbi:MAG: RNA polymerase-binding protein DksA, partial [Polynucleobacter victoriensis]
MSKKPLTEADLLKMSEKDYMNAAQLEFFKTKLLALKADLLMHANETTEHLRENVLVPDPADRATIEEEHALELRTRDRERKLLK